MNHSSLLLLLALTGLLAYAPSVSHAQTGITFTIDNVQLTTNSEGTVYEFDVMVAAAATGTQLGLTLALITYNTAGFGENVVANGAITVTAGTFISGNSNYGIALNDNSPSAVAITGTYNPFNLNNGEPLPTTPQQLFHVALNVSDPAATAGVGFDAVNMQGQQFEDDLDTSYEPVTADDTDNTLLPVELVEFTAQADGEAVQLRWATASETNNAGFEVQMHVTAPDGDGAAAWRSQGWVDGWGTTAEPQQYAYRMDGVTPGTHRFRLKQVDFGGAFTYSPEVEVTIGLDAAYRFTMPYPNPFNPEARFSLMVRRAQHVEVAVYDALGRRVQVLHDGPFAAGTAQAFVVEGQGFQSGVYFIRAIGETFVATQQATLVK